jgi:hypothetical protein
MYFLQHSGQPHLGLFVSGTGYGTDYVQLTVRGNLHEIGWLVGGIWLVIIGAVVTVIQHGYAALGLTFLALLITTLMCGILTEARVYLDFIPLLILAAHGIPSIRAEARRYARA